MKIYAGKFFFGNMSYFFIEWFKFLSTKRIFPQRFVLSTTEADTDTIQFCVLSALLTSLS